MKNTDFVKNSEFKISRYDLKSMRKMSGMLAIRQMNPLKLFAQKQISFKQ